MGTGALESSRRQPLTARIPNTHKFIIARVVVGILHLARCYYRCLLAGLGKPLIGVGMRAVTGELYPMIELCKVWLAIELMLHPTRRYM